MGKMERAKALERMFGDTVLVRILDFLTLAKDFDYCKAEIARNADVDVTSLMRVWPFLEKAKVVRKTRKIQNATMYKLNEHSEIAEQLVKLADKIAVHYALKDQRIIMEAAARSHTIRR